MNTSVDAVLAWLRGNVMFCSEFPKVFHRPVCAEDLAEALASYVRTSVPAIRASTAI